MKPEDRSRALRREADQVLDLIRLHDLCAPIGQLMPTGSYSMDLMMYPDIDLYLPQTKPEHLLGVAMELAKHDCVQRINFIRGGPGDLKDGLYLKPVVTYGCWERPWKIDIWSLPSPVAERKQADLDDLKSRMTPANRAIILETKYRLLTAEGRTPMFSGIYIYKAVVNNGLEKLDDIREFLKENGINV
jgi:hypothetical protein